MGGAAGDLDFPVACPAKEYSFPGNRTEYMTATQRHLDILMATALTSSPHSSVQESLVMPKTERLTVFLPRTPLLFFSVIKHLFVKFTFTGLGILFFKYGAKNMEVTGKFPGL